MAMTKTEVKPVTKPKAVISIAQKMRDRLNAKAGKELSKTYSEDDTLLQVNSWIPLKPFFKEATGGEGFPCGHITQLIGEPDSGKTTLLMEGMVSCQNLGGVVYLLDSEHKFDLRRFTLMGGDAEQVVVVDAESLEDAWDAILTICQSIKESQAEGETNPNMIAWDSIAASTPSKILEEDESGKAHMAVEAKLNNKNVRKLRALIRGANVALVGINHFYMTMPTGFGQISKLVVKGGEELTFMSILIVKTKQGRKLTREFKGDKQQIGRITRYEVSKGHFHGRTTNKDVWVIDRGILETKEEFAEYQATLKGKI